MSGYMVYICHDAEGSVLYVGATSCGQKRIRQHERRSAWFPSVERITYEHCDSAVHAAEREDALIRQYAPPYNDHRYRPYSHAPLVLNPHCPLEPLTLTEMAEAIGVKSTTALRRLCESGALKAEKKGKTWLVHVRDVEAYKRRRRRGRPRKVKDGDA